MKQYKFEITGLNTEKIINKVIKKHQIYDIKKFSHSCIFYCRAKDKKQINKIIKNSGQDIKNDGYIGISKVLKSFTRIGIISAVVISAILWIISTFFVTDIIFLGDINFTAKEISKVLENQNIKKWSLKSQIDLNKLETELLNIKYISYADAIIKGNSIVINIKEQLTNSEVVSIGNYEPIISCYDGIITSIKVIQGTANVQVGDIVKVGDVLVKPYVKKEDKELSVQPLADIVCDVWYTARLEVKDVMYKKIRTNNIIKNYNISAFGVDIYKKETPVSFEKYELEEKEEYLSNFIIPIKIKYKTYYEYKNQKIETNFEQNKQNYIQQTRQMSLLNIREYDIIKDESYSIKQTENSNIINYTVTISKKIC